MANTDLEKKLLARLDNELAAAQPPTEVPAFVKRNEAAARPVRTVEPPPEPPLRSDPRDYAKPEQRVDLATKALGPLPPYVTHDPEASKAAQLAGHAAVSEHEQYALVIERMGEEYHAQASAIIDDVILAARQIRERGAELFRNIQMSSKIGKEITDTVEEMRAKLGLQQRLQAESTTEREGNE